MNRDFVIQFEGSITLWLPITRAAKEFLAEHAPQDSDHQYFGAALVVEARYTEDFSANVAAAGLRF